MTIEKCIYFKRTTIEDGKAETQECGATKTAVECGGFSDWCVYPQLFVPDRFVKRENITFRPQAHLLDSILTQRRRRNQHKRT